jgi:hypothetical protein
LKNAFLLSKKLKRPLNNEEVGRFKIKWKLNGKEKQNF